MKIDQNLLKQILQYIKENKNCTLNDIEDYMTDIIICYFHVKRLEEMGLVEGKEILISEPYSEDEYYHQLITDDDGNIIEGVWEDEGYFITEKGLNYLC